MTESSAGPKSNVPQVAHDRKLGLSRQQSMLARKLSATAEFVEAKKAYPLVAAPPAAAGLNLAEADLEGLDEAFSPEMIAEARAQIVSASTHMHSLSVVPATGVPPTSLLSCA